MKENNSIFLLVGLLACISGALSQVTVADADLLKAKADLVISKVADLEGFSYDAYSNTIQDEILIFLNEGDVMADEVIALMDLFIVASNANTKLPSSFPADLETLQITNGRLGNIANQLYAQISEAGPMYLMGDLDGVFNNDIAPLLDDFEANLPADSVEATSSNIGESDPHFLVWLGKQRHPVCLDFQGKDDDVIQLLHDELPAAGHSEKISVTVNGQLFETRKSTPEHVMSFFSAVSVMLGEDCTLVAGSEGIRINGEEIEWERMGRYESCDGGMKLVVADNRVKVNTGLGIELIILLHHRPAVGDFVGFYFTELEGLSTHSHGILGQLHNMNVMITGNLTDTDSMGSMTFPSTPDKEPQKVKASFYHYDRITKQIPKCWKVKRDGKGVLDGEPQDYFQKEQNLYYNRLLPALKPYAM